FLATLAGSLAFPKTMRWRPDDTRFARPVRWLVALLGSESLPVKVFGLEAGRQSRGHRFLSPGPVEIGEPGRYLGVLERAYVLADHRARRDRIRERIAEASAQVGGVVREDEELLDRNTFLVEWPLAFAGSFDRRHLELPGEVVITALREHQAFFAVEARGGNGAHGKAEPRLLERFIAIRNGDERGLEVVRRGNEDVLAARLEDAQFYWATDLKHPPRER